MPQHETTRTDSDRPATTEPALPRRRIAIFAEAVTLAHVARPLALARGLDPERYDVTFVCDPRYADFLAAEPWRIHWIDSISGERFRDALAKGRPIYDAATLQRYVDDDLAVIDAVRPDVVVGDFRLSLSASARIAAIPYAAICSTYWSPYARQHYPIPDHPLVGMLGLATAQVLFDVFRPLAFAHHTRPLNRVRRSRGLPSLGLDLRHTYTDADWVLYADPPELVSTERLPVNHRYLGPVLWSPPVAPPAWWADLPDDRPVVYVTMGSSGSQHDLATALDALSGVDCTVIAATAGGGPVSVRSSRQFVADYLPGEAASQRAQLVVCNGGAPTSQQALAAGRPCSESREISISISTCNASSARVLACACAVTRRRQVPCEAPSSTCSQHRRLPQLRAGWRSRLPPRTLPAHSPRLWQRCWGNRRRRCHSLTSVGCRSLIFFAGTPPHSSLGGTTCSLSPTNPR